MRDRFSSTPESRTGCAPTAASLPSVRCSFRFSAWHGRSIAIEAASYGHRPALPVGAHPVRDHDTVAHRVRSYAIIPLRSAEERSRPAGKGELSEARDGRVVRQPVDGEHRREPMGRSPIGADAGVVFPLVTFL